MPVPDTKAVLWENISALMDARYGRENLTKLAREAKFAPATSTRLKEAKTSVGVEIVERLAGMFGVDPWQLLAPKLGAEMYVIDADRRVVPVQTPVPLAAWAQRVPALKLAATDVGVDADVAALKETVRRARRGRRPDPIRIAAEPKGAAKIKNRGST
jgi:hypothetical protein